jgi:RimJ/RimL family protein N-acetyltransferase
MAASVRLELLAPRHIDDMAALLTDPDVLRFTRVPDPVPSGFAESWYGNYESARVDGSREAFAALEQDGRFVGLGLAPEIDRQAREVELGYLVAPAARGRGVGVEILRSSRAGRSTTWARSAPT